MKKIVKIARRWETLDTPVCRDWSLCPQTSDFGGNFLTTA